MSLLKPSLHIVHDSESFVAISKPAGMLSIPDRQQKDKNNAQTILQNQYESIFTVHRLDKETSGIMLFAKSAEMHKALNQMFEERKIKKIYHALVEGVPIKTEGQINAAIAADPQQSGKMRIHPKGKESLTDYKIIRAYKGFCLISARIHTGRTHQVRVHMKHLGHPIVADGLYGKRTELYISDIKAKAKVGKNKEEQRPLLSRTALHAFGLSFIHPFTNETIELEAAYPKDLRAVISQLDKTNNYNK